MDLILIWEFIKHWIFTLVWHLLDWLFRSIRSEPKWITLDLPPPSKQIRRKRRRKQQVPQLIEIVKMSNSGRLVHRSESIKKKKIVSGSKRRKGSKAMKAVKGLIKATAQS